MLCTCLRQFLKDFSVCLFAYIPTHSNLVSLLWFKKKLVLVVLYFTQPQLVAYSKSLTICTISPHTRNKFPWIGQDQNLLNDTQVQQTVWRPIIKRVLNDQRSSVCTELSVRWLGGVALLRRLVLALAPRHRPSTTNWEECCILDITV